MHFGNALMSSSDRSYRGFGIRNGPPKTAVPAPHGHPYVLKFSKRFARDLRRFIVKKSGKKKKKDGARRAPKPRFSKHRPVRRCPRTATFVSVLRLAGMGQWGPSEGEYYPLGTSVRDMAAAATVWAVPNHAAALYRRAKQGKDGAAEV